MEELKTARAQLVHARIAPRKVQIVCDMIRGKDTKVAEAYMANTPKAGCELMLKLLKSACANAEKNLGSIADLTRLPSALFVVDVMKEAIAVKEAKRLGIPVFAIVDTNSNPNEADFMIPANDDAKDSVEVILNACCAAIAEGLEERKVEKADEKAAKEQAEANAIEDRPKRARKARKDAPAKDEAPAAETAAEEAPAEA